MTLPELLTKVVELDGSDLHLATRTPPQIRVHGHLERLDGPDLTPADTKALSYSVLADAQKKRFEEHLELDFSFGISGVGRFRCNLFHQRGAVGAVYRLIPEKIRSFQDLGLPAVLATLAEKPRGLILVTGPTGSGTSTTLAAMIDKINKERRDHILTIEDPIEFVHQHQGCLVNQREVHQDTENFGNALRVTIVVTDAAGSAPAAVADRERQRHPDRDHAHEAQVLGDREGDVLGRDRRAEHGQQEVHVLLPAVGQPLDPARRDDPVPEDEQTDEDRGEQPQSADLAEWDPRASIPGEREDQQDEHQPDVPDLDCREDEADDGEDEHAGVALGQPRPPPEVARREVHGRATDSRPTGPAAPGPVPRRTPAPARG